MRSLVSPSLQVMGSVYFSVWTSTPAARNAPTPHSTALAISDVPVTRPPISSVSRRKFSSIGDGPITIGRIFAAACAQVDVSETEQAAELLVTCAGLSGSFCCCGNWADGESRETNKQSSNEERRIVRRGMNGPSFLWSRVLAFRCSLAE